MRGQRQDVARLLDIRLLRVLRLRRSLRVLTDNAVRTGFGSRGRLDVDQSTGVGCGDSSQVACFCQFSESPVAFKFDGTEALTLVHKKHCEENVRAHLTSRQVLQDLREFPLPKAGHRKSTRGGKAQVWRNLRVETVEAGGRQTFFPRWLKHQSQLVTFSPSQTPPKWRGAGVIAPGDFEYLRLMEGGRL